MQPADPINPQRVFWELSPKLPDNCILTGDSGSVANWYARDIKIRRGMKGSLSGGLASLGAATPYALSAKMAFPERTVIGFIGDGAPETAHRPGVLSLRHKDVDDTLFDKDAGWPTAQTFVVERCKGVCADAFFRRAVVVPQMPDQRLRHARRRRPRQSVG